METPDTNTAAPEVPAAQDPRPEEFTADLGSVICHLSTVATAGGRLTVLQCPDCGIGFAAPETFVKRCRSWGGAMHCPNGHKVIFAARDLPAQFEDLQRDLEQLRNELRREQSRNRETVQGLEGLGRMVASNERREEELRRQKAASRRKQKAKPTGRA